jgi:NitT/TauT family transport system permease protein
MNRYQLGPHAAEAPGLFPARWRGFFARRRALLRGGLGVVFVLALWEFAARDVIRDERILAPFSKSLITLLSLVWTGEIWKHTVASGSEFLLGFSLATLAGIAAGFLMGTARVIREYLGPWFFGLYSAPLVALAPLYIMFFGIGTSAKVALVFTVVFFPVAINTLAGVASIDAGFIEVARSFGASRWQVFSKTLFPFSLAYIVAGLRLGVGRGLTGVVVAEFFFANAGVGFLVALAGQTFNTALLFAGVLLFAAAGAGLTEALKQLERKLAPWRHAAENP